MAEEIGYPSPAPGAPDLLYELAQRITRVIQDRTPEACRVAIDFDFGTVELEIVMTPRVRY